MKPSIRRPGAGRLAQWVGFIALVALLAMATLPLTGADRDTTAAATMGDTLPSALLGSSTWHG